MPNGPTGERPWNTLRSSVLGQGKFAGQSRCGRKGKKRGRGGRGPFLDGHGPSNAAPKLLQAVTFITPSTGPLRGCLCFFQKPGDYDAFERVLIEAIERVGGGDTS